MSTERGLRSEIRSIRGLLAEGALDRALIELERSKLQLKSWETQPTPAGQPDGGRWVNGPGGVPIELPPTSWTSLREGESGSDQERLNSTETTTLEDGTRVLSIKIRDRRGQYDEQHAVIAPNGDSRIFQRSGDTQTIRDGQTGEILSRTTFDPSGLIAEPIVRPALLQVVPPLLAALRAQRTLELALSLLAVLSAKREGFGAVLA